MSSVAARRTMLSSNPIIHYPEPLQGDPQDGDRAKKKPRIDPRVHPTVEEDGDTTDKTRGQYEEEMACLRAENEKLRAQLNTESKVPTVLGIDSSLCHGCGVAPGISERPYVRLGKLYCEDCWVVWERCGWWHPILRINTSLPSIGASGLPAYGPEDAFCVPAFACAPDDLSLMMRLRADLPGGKEFTDWNGARHLGLQFEGVEARHIHTSASQSLREVAGKLEAAFGIKASASRLNLYRSDNDYKTLHHDRGQDANGVPQVTVGLSLGATREIAFTHWQTGLTMTFPLSNGSVFAFTPELNHVFLHGIPKVHEKCQSSSEPLACAERLSFIMWGSRVTDQ